MLGSQPDSQRLGKDLWHGGRVMPPIEERYGTAKRAAETTARRIANHFGAPWVADLTVATRPLYALHCRVIDWKR